MVTWVEDSSVITLMGFSNLRLNKQINQEKLRWRCLLSILCVSFQLLAVYTGKLSSQIPCPYGAYTVIEEIHGE